MCVRVRHDVIHLERCELGSCEMSAGEWEVRREFKANVSPSLLLRTIHPRPALTAGSAWFEAGPLLHVSESVTLFLSHLRAAGVETKAAPW